MSCLWLWLSLLCASSFLPGASSQKGVSSAGVLLICNQTDDVAAENCVTLNCSIYIYKGNSDCRLENYLWQTKAGENLCNVNSGKYKCDWDEQNYVSLTISNPEAQNYTIRVQAKCDLVESSIKVQPKPKNAALKLSINGETEPQDPFSTVLIAALSIFTVIIVLGILLYFLQRSNREKGKPEYEMIHQTSPSIP